MSLFKRRLIYLTFMLLFVLIAPMLILYANGYRFDWNQKTLYKTGLLVIEYLPKDATLMIDDTAMATKSPARIGGLTPRNYTIRIEKEGYFSWEKRLWIPEYTTTFVRHVNLFKQSLPVHTDAMLTQFAPHPVHALVAVARVAPDGIHVERMTPRGTTTIPNLPIFTEVTTLSWSHQGQWLLVIGKSGGQTITRIVPLDEQAPIVPLESFVTMPLTRLTWDATNDDTLAGYTKIGKGVFLVTMNVDDKKVEQSIVPEQSYDLPFILDKDRVIILTPDHNGETTAIFRARIPSDKTIEQRVTIPSAPNDLRVTAEQEHLLTLLDTRTKRAYLIEREPRTTPPVIETFSNVLGTAWSPNGRRLAYWNDQEIFLWDLERNTKERIARVEDLIESVFWHPSNEYIFTKTKKTVDILEIDGRDHRNLVSLAKMQIAGTAAVDTKGQWLAIWDLFSATTGVDWYEIK
ncbi:WD40 repeat domain-containing protein [Candidatus Uhrbacteria bacterium]|nr:WD40 repeat domain-containing protein [Candidatus Uhrbacteria bacterium]